MAAVAEKIFKTEISIDSEFRSLLIPLTAEERAQLEKNILLEGCRDALVIWDGILIDGHNRYEICQTHNLPFDVVEAKGVSSREEAINWIVDNQLGRRNLTPEQQSYLRGKRYNREKKAAYGRSDRDLSGDQNDLPKTADKLATEYGVSAPTIKRDGKFAEAVDSIADNVGEEFRQEVLSEENPYTKKEIVEIAKLAPEEQQEVISTLKTGGHRTIGTGENEWYTPEEYIELARNVMGQIDTDPASNPFANKTVKAKAFFTKENDGLERKWSGKVWLNPPYSQPEIRLFTEKLVEEYQAGNVEEAILLTHNFTDTKWFAIAAAHSALICFTKGRIKFINGAQKKAAPTCGQAFFYFGENKNRFKEFFSPIGLIMEVEK